MTDKYCVGIIHNCLKSKDKWFIDFYCPDDDRLKDICSQALENANERLGNLSIFALYQRYCSWKRSDKMIPCNEPFFQVFLSQVCFDLGLRAVSGEDKILFEENCSFTHKFINSKN